MLRKCNLDDFQVKDQFIVDKMDQNSAKYAVCMDLVSSLNPDAGSDDGETSSDLKGEENFEDEEIEKELWIDDDYVEIDTKYISISVKPCSELNKNTQIYKNFLADSKKNVPPTPPPPPPTGKIDASKSEVLKKPPPPKQEMDMKFCRPDRDSILSQNKLILIFGYNEVTYNFQNFKSPIDYNYNTERWFHCFMEKTFERKLFFSETSIITDKGIATVDKHTDHAMQFYKELNQDSER